MTTTCGKLFQSLTILLRKENIPKLVVKVGSKDQCLVQRYQNLNNILKPESYHHAYVRLSSKVHNPDEINLWS